MVWYNMYNMVYLFIHFSLVSTVLSISIIVCYSNTVKCDKIAHLHNIFIVLSIMQYLSPQRMLFYKIHVH